MTSVWFLVFIGSCTEVCRFWATFSFPPKVLTHFQLKTGFSISPWMCMFTWALSDLIKGDNSQRGLILCHLSVNSDVSLGGYLKLQPDYNQQLWVLDAIKILTDMQSVKWKGYCCQWAKLIFKLFLCMFFSPSFSSPRFLIDMCCACTSPKLCYSDIVDLWYFFFVLFFPVWNKSDVICTKVFWLKAHRLTKGSGVRHSLGSKVICYEACPF